MNMVKGQQIDGLSVKFIYSDTIAFKTIAC
jgi:hypothetical protein